MPSIGAPAWNARFVDYARTLERKFNGGTYQQGDLATALAMSPPVLLAAAAFWLADAVHPALGLLVKRSSCIS